MKDIKLYDISPETGKINGLALRVFDTLDPYEISDTETTLNQVARDLRERPLDIIDYLLTIIEDL